MRHKSLVLLVAIVMCLVIRTAPPAHAEPATDQQRSAQCAHFDGVAYTFCVALCVARECDHRTRADARCALLRRGFARLAVGALPCENTTLAAARPPR